MQSFHRAVMAHASLVLSVVAIIQHVVLDFLVECVSVDTEF